MSHEKPTASVSTAESSFSCGRRSGKKSIWRALASFAAVLKEKFTSWVMTFVM